jgi:uncharacterized damage-inducible protein DinB
MNAAEILVLNLEEIRRRSIKIWREIPLEKLNWKPDQEAMSCLEMVRHVLEGELLYHQMLKSGGNLDTHETPFAERVWTNVEDEINFAEPFRKEFLGFVKSLSDEDLTKRKVDRSERGYIREFGDFILRIGYHESVHAGQMLSYLRTANVSRANIWD